MCVIVCSQPDGSILDSAIEDHYGGLDNYVSYMSKDGSWGDGLILSVSTRDPLTHVGLANSNNNIFIV